ATVSYDCFKARSFFGHQKGCNIPRSLGKRNVRWVTTNMEIFTAHYGSRQRARARKPRLVERANPVDSLFDALDRNDL
ncbi:hypothetical protein, partial [Burkholderia sp. SIMBA_052]|uniref:hypothetical protein n=1 Tax=Burkholderia sp. SIMBA_052 TaxID=3085793 RepID=UPI00397BC229